MKVSVWGGEEFLFRLFDFSLETDEVLQKETQAP
jgi:hypothetical protein